MRIAGKYTEVQRIVNDFIKWEITDLSRVDGYELLNENENSLGYKFFELPMAVRRGDTFSFRFHCGNPFHYKATKMRLFQCKGKGLYSGSKLVMNWSSDGF